LILNPLLYLTGTNSSGKSSLTKALMLMKSIKFNPTASHIDFEECDLDNFFDLNIGNFNNWTNDSQMIAI
jgi:AAA15 family ATPase/GTPase